MSTSTVAVDLGCGCGYGTRILSEGSNDQVTYGVDLDRDTVNMALRDYGNLKQIAFSTIPNTFGLDQPWENHVRDSIDLAVCFETLEMIRHRDLFLDQLTQRLNRNSIALFSAGLFRMAPDCKPASGYFRYDGGLLLRTLSRYFEVVRTLNDDVSADGPFQYVRDLNRSIKDAASGGEPLQVGRDLVYCAKPIRK